ncbi:MAG: YidC/Oxa1 family membrane protein insertase [Bacilli bacterium]|jgi:YidC/Oxa1 family membrane protein insertase|nr:YidC/Oxa1 family membrane protein insertase [Bacillota bacterium]NLM31801.1 YidC/Oxa1 family membrane protein insertase [Acholeplasmataceae bacterium]HOA78083.1 YidC/Oxa1 family membrane protein insertase [Bacilli bacterium]HPZ26591.1 YidC/Oxa1 family membrane protein insertase [Bacilli bacterium]HQC89065.1 YidC/Oxa1 family membrane protein insertase [Bacilli bacterium]
MREKRKYLYLVLLVAMSLFLTSCGGGGIRYTPIDGFKSGWDILVWPMAFLMYGIGKTVAFNYYSLTILFATIIVRTLAWPIYAKTNDLSLKMKLMAPHQAKIEAKYAGKDDPISQQRKQMEMMQLFKKYGVGPAGCLLPFLQLPIFLAFFQTLQRIPLTKGSQYKLDFSFMNGRIFGLDLFDTRGDVVGTYQWWGVVVLAALVGITQVISQIIATRRQNKMKREAQSDVPAYRQPQPDQMQKQTEIMMKIMLYFMTAMMVFFVYQSAAALGLYWLVGNIYTTLQGYVGHLFSKKREEKLKKRI